ncbi:MAG: hypothetical protein ACRDLZ_04255, partial [Gaiellaceae bacterium]
MRICRGSKPVCAYRALADRVAASGATAVFLGGLIDTNAARVIRDLRARPSDRVDLLAPDGLTPLPLLLRRAGPAAVGTYVSLTGIVTDRVPPAGQRFARTQAGVEVEPSAVYTAQATEVLLDAIGRSDGTRSSIVEELFRTRVSGGLLGTFEFDENGDVSESPVTILQVRPRDPSASTRARAAPSSASSAPRRGSLPPRTSRPSVREPGNPSVSRWRTHWRTGSKLPANRHIRSGLENRRNPVCPIKGAGA